MATQSSSTDAVDAGGISEKESECSASIQQGEAGTDLEKQLERTAQGGSADSSNGQGTEPEPSADAGGVDFAEQNAGDKPSNGLVGVLSKVVSRASVKSNPGPPPDGGSKAWITVACGHLVVMNTWGFINSFGVFQPYYVTALARPPSSISWIGSFQIFLLFFVGTLSGRATDAGYFRPILLLGSVFQIIGIFTSANATQYWQLFLSQGVCMGLGNGCLFCPALAVLSTYFSKKRSFAIGLTASGAATGGMVFPSMARELLPSVGFAWTMRAIGFVQLGTLIIANTFLRPRIPPRRSGALVDWASFKELEYTLYAVATFLCFLGLYFPFFFVVSFSRDIIGMPFSSSLNLLLVLNGSGVLGRLGPNLLADRFGPMTIFVPAAFISAVCIFCWGAVTSEAGLYVWVVFYGTAAGGIQSLFPAGLTSLTTDLKKAGVRIGMIFTINSFATLMGPPIAGAIITSTGGKYYGAQGFAGAVMLLGMVFMAAARTMKMRKIGEGWMAKI